MRAKILVACALLLSAACKDARKPPKKIVEAEARPIELGPSTAVPLGPGLRVEIGDSKGACARTLCILGPGERVDPPNRDLAELCRRAPGVVRRCEGDRCASAWALDEWQQGLDGLITSLDGNADGKLDERDPSCRIHAAGWSRGATIAATELPAALRSDPRVGSSRAVIEHLVAIAPFVPGQPELRVADEVRKAWIYRHTQTPADDCSKSFEGGPWLSPTPVCGAGTRCWDYDYSLEPELAFIGRQGARSGLEIGHCEIASVVAKIGLDNLARGLEARAELVPRLSNGEPGGRVEGAAKRAPIELLDNPPAPD